MIESLEKLKNYDLKGLEKSHDDWVFCFARIINTLSILDVKIDRIINGLGGICG